MHAGQVAPPLRNLLVAQTSRATNNTRDIMKKVKIKAADFGGRTDSDFFLYWLK